MHWADTPSAAWALFILAFAEASFFPIPPDVLLIAMAVAAPKKSLRYAGICLAGSVAGGALGYVIGKFFFDAVGAPLLDLYHGWHTYEAITAKFQEHGFLYIFAAALTPIPYKVFTIAAGVCRVNFAVLVAASVVGRGLRFFAVGGLFLVFGARIKRFIERYLNLLTVLFLVLLLVGFLCAKILWSRPEGAEEPGGNPEQPAGTEQVEDAAPRPATAERGGTMLSEEAQQRLMELARHTVEAVVKGQEVPPLEETHAELQGKQGAFVTLKTNGDLRGCIGRFVSDKPLWKTVRAMAIAAAAEDPRFVGMRIRPSELPRLQVEISVLSPLERIENPLDIELGTHGIYIKRGMRSGCFLPQVATETGWSKEEFLSHCCAGKAGLPANAWKDPDTAVLVFTAQIIEDH